MASGPLDWQHIRARPTILTAIVLAATVAIVLLGFGGAYLALTWHPSHDDRQVGGRPVAARSAEPAQTASTPARALTPEEETRALSEGLRMQPLDPDQARLFNSGIPISTLPNPAARPFVLPATLDPQMRARATDCLTAAIYYEAAHEPLDGQRAVAQVVLNRVRHFAYPKSVCEVVFQGADQPGSCQFTFACDGSITHPPEPALWKKAHVVAEQALMGRIAAPVGRATHYHADYVAPYWQPYLVKVAVIGQHIFYRGDGDWSASAAFTGPYSGTEPDQPLMSGLWSEAAQSPPVVDPGALPPPAPAPVELPALAPPEVSPPSPASSTGAQHVPVADAAPPAPKPAPVAPDSKSRTRVPISRRIPT